MLTAKKHPNEKDRLEALRSLELLDTVNEKEFDDITYLASQICNTPIAARRVIPSGIAPAMRKRDWSLEFLADCHSASKPIPANKHKPKLM